MMKTVSLVIALAAVCMAQQRPSYFPRPGGFNTVLSHYQPENTGDAASTVETGDRTGASTFQPAAPGSNGYLEDTQLINRVQNWPKEKLPFWYVNREHIQDHRGRPVPCSGEGCPQNQFTAPRSSFAGRPN